ncbi:MAG: ROK family protein, partial [Actinobacteria bacterium]|nr:ROK family protein [Actinomycetota bacterium]
ARAGVEGFVRGVATGIATVTMAVDPDVVVVGGGLSRAGEELLRPLRAAVMSEIGVPVRPSIIQSELGAESVVLGALALASGQAMERLYQASDLPEPEIDVAAARAMAAQETAGSVAG